MELKNAGLLVSDISEIFCKKKTDIIFSLYREKEATA